MTTGIFTVLDARRTGCTVLAVGIAIIAIVIIPATASETGRSYPTRGTVELNASAYGYYSVLEARDSDAGTREYYASLFPAADYYFADRLHAGVGFAFNYLHHEYTGTAAGHPDTTWGYGGLVRLGYTFDVTGKNLFFDLAGQLGATRVEQLTDMSGIEKYSWSATLFFTFVYDTGNGLLKTGPAFRYYEDDDVMEYRFIAVTLGYGVYF